jgi:hypothetical protein
MRTNGTTVIATKTAMVAKPKKASVSNSKTPQALIFGALSQLSCGLFAGSLCISSGQYIIDHWTHFIRDGVDALELAKF